MESNKPIDIKKLNEKQDVMTKVILGDDLGAEMYFNLLSRFEFKQVPYLKQYNIRPFLYAEGIFYPSISV